MVSEMLIWFYEKHTTLQPQFIFSEWLSAKISIQCQELHKVDK